MARYYLRYGTQDLPPDGRLPELTWAGARHVDNLIMVGTPNAGSIQALKVLVDGFKPAFLLPRYPAALLGTLPAVYALLPRNRHLPLLDTDNHPVDDIYDPALWIKQRWGLADPDQDRVLQMLLPDAADVAQRRLIAVDHLQKCLRRARQFAEAMDRPAQAPAGLNYYLVVGDSEDTAKTAFIQQGTAAQHCSVSRTFCHDGHGAVGVYARRFSGILRVAHHQVIIQPRRRLGRPVHGFSELTRTSQTFLEMINSD